MSEDRYSSVAPGQRSRRASQTATHIRTINWMDFHYLRSGLKSTYKVVSRCLNTDNGLYSMEVSYYLDTISTTHTG